MIEMIDLVLPLFTQSKLPLLFHIVIAGTLMATFLFSLSYPVLSTLVLTHSPHALPQEDFSGLDWHHDSIY